MLSKSFSWWQILLMKAGSRNFDKDCWGCENTSSISTEWRLFFISDPEWEGTLKKVDGVMQGQSSKSQSLTPEADNVLLCLIEVTLIMPVFFCMIYSSCKDAFSLFTGSPLDAFEILAKGGNSAKYHGIASAASCNCFFIKLDHSCFTHIETHYMWWTNHEVCSATHGLCAVPLQCDLKPRCGFPSLTLSTYRSCPISWRFLECNT